VLVELSVMAQELSSELVVYFRSPNPITADLRSHTVGTDTLSAVLSVIAPASTTR
jgi:hypothetical protein